jgi:hypothetical protein
MDAVEPIFLSPAELYGAIGTAAAPIVIDVRRGAAFAADPRIVVGAVRRNPDDYGAKAAAYVDAFMAAINWPNVARAYGELRS